MLGGVRPQPRGMRLRNKMILGFSLFAIVPILTLGVVFIAFHRQDMRRKAVEQTSQVLYQITARLDNMLREVDSHMQVILRDRELINWLEYNAGDAVDAANRELRSTQLYTFTSIGLLYNAPSSVPFKNLIILDGNDNAYYLGTEKFNFNYNFPATEWYGDSVSKNGIRASFLSESPDYLINGVGKRYVTFSRGVALPSGGFMTIIADVDVFAFSFMAQYTQLGETGEVFITDSDWAPVGVPDNPDRLASIIEHFQISGEKNLLLKDGADSLLCVYQRSGIRGWRAIGVIPYGEITAESNDILRSAFIISALLALLLAVVSTFISAGISHPIRVLLIWMRRVETGDLDDIGAPAAKGSSEVIELTLGFGQLIRHIRQLLWWEKKTRLDTLSEQINPHFLYNSLNSVYMSAIANDDEDTAVQLKSLSDFLRAVVKESNPTTLNRELDIVRRYVDFQKLRCGDSFDFSISVDSEVEPCMVPKMVLQPIVENSIIHGLPNAIERGRLDISAARVGAEIHIRVSDNGGGFSSESLNMVRNSHETSSKIGLPNIMERIQLYYGPAYGIDIDSDSMGSSVLIRIPPDIPKEEAP